MERNQQLSGNYLPHWINVYDTWTFSRRSLRACVRLCIWLPHLRTRRCVILIWIFSCRSHRTCCKTQALTRCFEYPKAVRCTRTLRCWRACYSLRNQVQRRSWLCHNSFFSCSILYPCRHYFKTIGGTENADIEQTEKMVPLITCEIAFRQYVCELFFWCQRIWFGSSGPSWFCQLTYQAQLWGFGTRVSLLDFCLWWSSWSPLHYLRTRTGRFHVWGDIVDIG